MRLRRVGLALGLCGLAAAALLWLLVPVLARRLLWPAALERARQTSGLSVQADLLSVSPARGLVAAGRIHVGSATAPLAARLGRLDVRLVPWSLLSKRPRATWLRLQDLDLSLDLDRAGELADLLSRLAGGSDPSEGLRADRIELQESALRLRRGGREILLSGLSGTAAFDAAGKLESARLAGLSGSLALEAALGAAGELRLTARSPEPPADLLLWLGVPVLEWGGASFAELSASTGGGSIKGTVHAKAEGLSLAAPPVQTPLELEARFDLSGRIAAIEIDRLASRFTTLRRVRLRADSRTGRVLLLEPVSAEIDLDSLDGRLHGRLHGRIERLERRAEGALDVSARLRATGLATPPGAVRIQDGHADLDVSVRAEPGGSWRASAHGEIGDVLLPPPVGGDAARLAVAVDAVRTSPGADVAFHAGVSGEGVGRHEVSGRIGGGAVRSATVSGGEVPLSRLVASGSGRLAYRLAYEASEPQRLAGEVRARDAGISLPEIEAEGVEVTAAVDLLIGEERVATLSASGQAAGEALVSGRYLVDTRARPARFAFGATYRLDERSATLANARLSVGDVVEIALTGELSGLGSAAGAELAMDLRIPDLGAFHESLVAPNLASSHLEKLVLSGSLEARLESAVPPDAPFRAAGRLSLRDVSAHSSNPPVDLDGLDATIPIGIGSPAPSDVAILSARGIAAGPFKASPLCLVFRRDSDAWRNAPSLEPIEVSAYGGSLWIDDLVIRNAGALAGRAPDATISGKVGLEGLDVALIFPNLAREYPFSGTLHTESDLAVALSPGRLHVQGTALVDVFRGRIRIEGLEAERPFSDLARFRTAMTWRGIDLERVSEVFRYGRVSGVVEADVTYLTVSAGEIESFLARFRTVDRGVRQRIGLRALRQMPFLSEQGRLTLEGHLARFLGDFRYSKMGAALALRNGAFQLHGRFDAKGRDLFATPETYRWPLHRPEGITEFLVVPAGLLPPRLEIRVEPAIYGMPFDKFVEQLRNARDAVIE